MARTGESVSVNAGSMGACDSGGAVLDHDGVFGGCVHLVEGIKEKVWCGLAVFNLDFGEDAALVEIFHQTCDREAFHDIVALTVRGDADLVIIVKFFQ